MSTSTPRIKMTHAYGETPPNVFNDFDWIHQHENELLEKYGECFVIVYKETVLGVGATYDEAIQDAERNLPAGNDEVTPVHRRIFKRHHLFRVYPSVN